MPIKFDGHGTLITVSFYMQEQDHPFNAGVTIRRAKAGRRGVGPSVEERWLPVERTDALALLKHLGSNVNAVWAVGERAAVILP